MGDEIFDIGAFDIERTRGFRARREQGDCAQSSDDEATGFQEPMSLRCECSDIKMPKPANRVTIEVPP